MKKISKSIIVLALLSMMNLAGCTSIHLIDSKPPGAKVMIDNKDVGTTPVKAKINTGGKGKTHSLILKKADYQDLTAELKNTKITTGNVILSLLFFAPALFFTWQPEQDSYIFTLEPSDAKEVPLENGKKGEGEK